MRAQTLMTLLVALAAIVFFLVKDGASEAPPLPEDEAASTQEPQADPALGSDRSMLDSTRRELERERERLADVKEERAALEAEISRKKSERAVEAPREEPSETKAVFVHPGMEKTLNAVKWNDVGEAVVNIMPHLEELKTALSTGEPVPPSVAQLQRWNAPLLEMALAAHQDGVPGTGVNGTFTHPAIAVNMIISTLANAGQPLDESQLADIEKIARRFVEEDERRLAGYEGTELQLEKTIGETALRDRFYADADALLTEEQRDVLHPEGVRGRLGIDLFSSGVLWNVLTRPVRYKERGELAGTMVSVLVRRLSIESDQRESIEAVVVAWIDGFSDAYWEGTYDPVARSAGALTGGQTAGWLRLEQAQAAAKHQLTLWRRLLAVLPADSEAAKKIRRSPLVLVPVKRGEAE